MNITSSKLKREIIETISKDLLLNEVTIGDRTREVVYKVLDTAIADIKKEENFKRIKVDLLPLMSTIYATGFSDRSD